MTEKKTPPWKRKNPNKSKEKTVLSEEYKALAKKRADAAGRPYPNLVDNMWASLEQKKALSALKKRKFNIEDL